VHGFVLFATYIFCRRKEVEGRGMVFAFPNPSPHLLFSSFPHTILYLYLDILISVFYTTRSFLFVTHYSITFNRITL
jgi:hypothetical protein